MGRGYLGGGGGVSGILCKRESYTSAKRIFFTKVGTEDKILYSFADDRFVGGAGLLCDRVGGEFPGWTVPARGRLHGDDAQGPARRVPTGTRSGAAKLRHGSVRNRRRQYVLQ